MQKEEPGDSHAIVNEWEGAWVFPDQVSVVWAISGKPT
jgi:hypothetical protein